MKKRRLRPTEFQVGVLLIGLVLCSVLCLVPAFFVCVISPKCIEANRQESIAALEIEKERAAFEIVQQREQLELEMEFWERKAEVTSNYEYTLKYHLTGQISHLIMQVAEMFQSDNPRLETLNRED